MGFSGKLFRGPCAACLRIAALALLWAASTATALAQNAAGQTSGTYLALGDSVSFGYIAPNGYAQLNPDNFLGYPFWLGEQLHLATVNAACPGQTSGGFISGSTPDNGCLLYRAAYPLHVAYTGSQLGFAIQYLSAHKDVKLVTVMLGANDLYLLQQACSGDASCIAKGLPATLTALASNMIRILAELKATGYKGQMVLVNYYSLDYTDLLVTGSVAAMNLTLAAVAGSFGIPVADSFSAFLAAASAAQGQTCRAALLNVSPGSPPQCDDHPSQSGHRLLAKTVAKAGGF